MLLHDNKPGNLEREVDQTFGDVDAGFAAADLVREQTFHYAEVAHAQIELNAAVADYDPERDRLTMHSVTQVPYYLHLTLAQLPRHGQLAHPRRSSPSSAAASATASSRSTSRSSPRRWRAPPAAR